MTQLRKRKTVVPHAKKRAMRSNEMTAEIPEGMASQEKQTKTTTKKGDMTMEATKKFAGYEMKDVSESFLKMMKYSLDTTFDGLAKIQEFNDKIIKDTITTSKQIQADAEKVVVEWSENSKKDWDEYRKIVEKGFKQATDLIQPTM
jgi:hypothetical protein